MKLIYSGGFSVNVIPAIFHKKYTKLLHLLNDFIFLLTSSSPLIRPRPFKRIKSSLACHFSLVDYPISHWNTYYSNKQGCDLLIYVDFKHTSWLGVLIGRGKISVIFCIIFVCKSLFVSWINASYSSHWFKQKNNLCCLTTHSWASEGRLDLVICLPGKYD